MELCIKCGNPTAGDVTGSLYCVVCGAIQPHETASLPDESPVFRGILADVPVLPGVKTPISKATDTASDFDLVEFISKQLSMKQDRCFDEHGLYNPERT